MNAIVICWFVLNISTLLNIDMIDYIIDCMVGSWRNMNLQSHTTYIYSR